MEKLSLYTIAGHKVFDFSDDDVVITPIKEGDITITFPIELGESLWRLASGQPEQKPSWKVCL